MSVLEKINKLSDNVVSVPLNTSYTAILGLTPSKGARSPILWNAAYKKFLSKFRMVPIDVSEKNFLPLLSLLKSDLNFLGGAIAAPHKESAASFCAENLTSEAQSIGAINCLFRDKKGNLCGTNTDGEGSVIAFESVYGSIRDKRILILGAGGTGKAVAAYFSSRLKDKKQLTISSRSESAKHLAKKIGCQSLRWASRAHKINSNDIIINCTSLGSTSNLEMTPLSSQNINSLNKNIFIYDVIYDPIETAFCLSAKEAGLKYMNGLTMNFEQAVIGFHYSFSKGERNLDVNNIRSAMKNV